MKGCIAEKGVDFSLYNPVKNAFNQIPVKLATCKS